MPPPLKIWGACRALALRTRPVTISQQAPRLAALSRPSLASSRTFSDHTTQQPPSVSGQTQSSVPPSSSASTSSRAANSLSSRPVDPLANELAQTTDEDDFPEPESADQEQALHQLQLASYGLDPFDPNLAGHKFGLPQLPLAKDNHPKYRYDPVVVQATRLLMRDGKLAKAQRDMAMILNHLRTCPPPKLNPAKPLLPGSPPPSQLPLNPVLYMTLAVDSVAPLIRIRHIKGAAGGGRALEVPYPLAARQRRRLAFVWILDTVNKKPSKGSGRAMFPHRVAEEIVAVVEGRSAVWDKRLQWHKQGTAARANLSFKKPKRRKSA